jgi:hypothetical protein
MIRTWLLKYFKRDIERAVSARLAVENENTFLVGARSLGGDYREMYEYSRMEVLEECLEAWRYNPLARRIVGLTSQYTVGGGITLSCEHKATQEFINEFWEHRLNQMSAAVYEWADELTRSGELFISLSTDSAGMSYARAVPACNIVEILTQPNDIKQELRYVEASGEGIEGRTWPSVESALDWEPCMLHFAINRPVGVVHGESDLAPLLRWLKRYAGWLEDRARLNRWRNTFAWVVSNNFTSEAERAARQASLSAAGPEPGSILVKDHTETWEVIAPKLDSGNAGEDGLALKKMIAAGAGVPLHFLAEPESSTRTTSESAGGPTYRHFEQRQKFFIWLLHDLLVQVVRRRAGVAGGGVEPSAKISVTGADLSARDNAAQAIAASSIINAMKEMRDRGIIDDSEMARMVYKFAGEVVELSSLVSAGALAGQVKNLNPEKKAQGGGSLPSVPGAKVGADGEVKGAGAV